MRKYNQEKGKGLQIMKKATKKFIVAVLLVGLLVIVGKPSGNTTPAPLGFDPGELYTVDI
ncbi:TPA: hypothetical protein ACGOZZ_000694 [Streptococcus suis]